MRAAAASRVAHLARLRFQKDADDEPWLAITWSLAITQTGHYFSVERGACDDRAWEHAKQLPAKLGACEVLSGFTSGICP